MIDQKTFWHIVLAANEPKPAKKFKKLDIPFGILKESRWGTGEIIDQTDSETQDLSKLREFYPELADWGSTALYEAWGFYSQDSSLVSRLDISERDDWFIGYLFQIENGFPIGEEVVDLELAIEGFEELKKLYTSGT